LAWTLVYWSMQTMNTLQPFELNATIRQMGFPAPKSWHRVDCGQIEAYVGDKLYVIALVEKCPDNIAELKENQSKTEHTVIKYLQSEGFVGKEYVYVGMQRFNLKKPPEGLLGEDEGLA
jgi:hypothetical protein